MNQKDTQGWIKGIPVPHGKHRFGHGCSEIDGHRMIILGGVDVKTGRMLSNGAIYDSRTQAWTNLPHNMPVALCDCRVVANEKDVYVIGVAFKCATSPTNVLFRLSLNTLQWTTMTPMSNGRDSFAAVLKGDYIYVFGGYHTRRLSSPERYSIVDDSWEDIPDIPRIRHHLGAVVLGNDIYIMGDRVRPLLDIFDTVSLRWKMEENQEKVPKTIESAAIVALKGRYLAAIGGWNSQSGCLRSCFIYDSVFNCWSETPKSLYMNAALRHHTAAVLDGKVVVFGGIGCSIQDHSSFVEYISVDDLLYCAPLIYPLPPFYFNQVLMLGKYGKRNKNTEHRHDIEYR